MSEINTDISFKYICHNCDGETRTWLSDNGLCNVFQKMLSGRWPFGRCPYCGYLNECDIEYLEREDG